MGGPRAAASGCCVHGPTITAAARSELGANLAIAERDCSICCILDNGGWATGARLVDEPGEAEVPEVDEVDMLKEGTGIINAYGYLQGSR